MSERLVLASEPGSADARSWAAWLRGHFPASPFTRAATVLAIATADLGPLSRMLKWVPTLGAEALCPDD